MRTAGCALVLLAACARLTGHTGPEPTSVTPRGAYRGQAPVVRIRGAGFQVRGVQHPGSGPSVASDFTVRIGGRTLGAALVSDADGEAALDVEVPADLPVGVHDVEVIDPYGLSGVLHGAFTESVGPPPLLSVHLDAPARAETGSPAGVVVTVANEGSEAATAVLVNLEGRTLSSGASLAPGATLRMNGAAPDPGRGPHQLAVAVSGTDGVTGLPLDGAAGVASVDFVSPPALRVTAYPPPAAIDVGQSFTLRMDLTNDGDVDAAAVQVALDPDVALSATLPAQQDVPAGATRTFLLDALGASPGTVAPLARTASFDALTSNPLPPVQVSWRTMAVQVPAALRVAATTAPATVSTGQEFDVDALVANDGDAAALGIQDLSVATPNLAVVVSPPPQPISGHGAASFRWRLRANATGAATLGLSLSGTDANSGWTATAAGLASVAVQAPASLSVESVSIPGSLSRGEPFTLAAVIRNQGEASAASLQAACAVAATGGAGAACTPAGGPTVLPGGSAGTFTWACVENGTAPGTLTISAAASGLDANSLAAVSAAPLAASTTVQSPASLAIASVGLPPALSRGQPFTILATVSNTGGAAAVGVQSSALGITATGGANATCTPLAAPSAVAGGASATFSWSCQESGTGSGTLAFTVRLTGADSNSGAPLSAAATSSAAIVQQPANLAVSSLVVPSALSRGQSWSAELTVRNSGEATARSVTPDLAFALSGGATLTVVAAPAAQDLPGGASASFTWSLRESGTSAGSITLDAGVSGVDENSGASLSARASTPGIVVEEPAALVIESVSIPPLLSQGQSFTVSAVVRNDGAASAVSMAVAALAIAGSGADASCAPQAAPATIAGTAAAIYTWSCLENGTSTGTLAISVSASGADANSSAVLSAGPTTSATAIVQRPAALAMSLSLPATLSRGQPFAVVAAVTNSGEALAAGVTPGVLAAAVTGGAGAACTAGWTPASIPGGATATFSWTCQENGSASGTLSVGLDVTGSDANSGAALLASATSAAAAVQQPAALRVSSVAAPPALSRGQAFTFSITVANSGEATALAVTPALAAIVSGGAALTIVAPPVPQDIAGAASVTFTWNLRESGSSPGTMVLQASASGTDANSGTALSTSASTLSIPVQEPASLSIDSVSLPLLLSRGQSFAVTAVVRNSGGARAVSMQVPASSVAGPGVAATCTVQAAPAAIAGGAAATYSWACRENGTATGPLAFSVSAAGSDENSSVALSAGPVSSATATVEQPAALVASIATSPSLSRGQTFTVLATVTNSGEAQAAGVQPGLLAISATGGANAICTPAWKSASISGGTFASFAWSCVESGTGSGSLSFAVQVTGLDENSAATLSASAPPFTAAVQQPAALRISAVSAPAALSRGQGFTLSVTVSNAGEAVAQGVGSAALTVSANGGPAVAVLASPGTQDIAGGAAATYSWSLRENGAGPGTLQLRATFSGADANSGAAVSAIADTALIEVQNPAALALGAVSLPSPLSQGQPFTVTAEVVNPGGAPAVSISAPLPVVTATGGAAAVCAPQSAPSSIAGGTSATLSWSCDESGTSTGTLAFAVSVSGADGNSGAGVAAGPVSSATVSVQAAAQLSISSWASPAVLSRGETFTVVVGVSNNAGATARAVQPGTLAIIATGGASAVCTPSFAPADIPGNATATFSWTCQETGAASGTLAFAVDASGTDANSGALVTSPISTSTAHAVQEPAALSIASFALPPTLSRGQTFTATLVLVNSGQANAHAVLPSALSASVTGGTALTVSSSPAAQDIVGGGSATFTWTCRESGTGPGTLQLAVTASGTDLNSGADVTAAGSTSPSTVQNAAAIAIESISVPASITRGQAFDVVATVRNTGGATAHSVTPSQPTVVATGGAAASTTTAQAPVDIAGGASATFTWHYGENGAGSGTLAFGISASGTDANSGATISARTVTSNAFAVQQPPILSLSSFAARSSLGSSTVNTGQPFTVTIGVANGGEAAAAAVLANPHPPSQTATGGAQAAVAALPDPVTIAGGTSATLTYGYVAGTAPGTISFSAGASGSDANSGASLLAAARSASLTVQAPAALSATLTTPASLSVGDRAAISLSVTNVGNATANGVTPATLVLGGTASATILSAPAPANATLAAGASATFAWTLSITSSGTLDITAGASGVDANDGGTRTASATVSQPVNPQPENKLLTVTDPFGGDGTTFSYLFPYQGMVYLGPNKSGTGAVRMAPDGSSQAAVNWQLEVNTSATTPASNRAYQPPNPAICHTIGSPACNPNSLTAPLCGPDNETGRASFASGFVNGTEWYLISGASASGSFARYVYLTNGNFPLAPGGYDDLAWVQIQGTQTGGTRTTTVTSFLRNAAYLGFLADASNTPSDAPVLNVLKTMPAAPVPGSNGFVAAPGTDIVDLGARFMPAIGGSGQPANRNLAGSAWLMVDSIAEMGTAVYVANNGGITRSVTPEPSPCTASGCTNWANATPSAPAWTAKTSPTVDKTILAALEPAQKGVPAIVQFGARLFAARNTTTGPQLWACNPATANGGDPQQCERDEWSLVAPNSTGDLQLTQFNNGANSAIALLAATPSHLYVGFNDASGVQIFRTSTANAAARSDFTGMQGCDASLSACRGLGSDVFGAAVTRIYDARALTYSGSDWLYVSAGDGSASPRVFRMAP